MFYIRKKSPLINTPVKDEVIECDIEETYCQIGEGTWCDFREEAGEKWIWWFFMRNIIKEYLENLKRSLSPRKLSSVPPRSVGVSHCLEVAVAVASLPVFVTLYIYIHCNTQKKRKER